MTSKAGHVVVLILLGNFERNGIPFMNSVSQIRSVPEGAMSQVLRKRLSWHSAWMCSVKRARSLTSDTPL